MKRIVLLLLLGLMLTACAGGEAAESTQPTVLRLPETLPVFPTETTPALSPAQMLLENMTLREKVGQLFIVTPEGLIPEQAPVRVFSEELALALEAYPVGGIILFGDNLESPEQLAAFNAALATATKIPLFRSVDEEGGLVARLANHPAFSVPRYRSAASVGASGNPTDALEMGRTIGAYLHQYGFNLNFAPVADVNTNPRNPVIGTRAFSSDPETAAQMAYAMAQGLNEAGVRAVYKHFPGHGDTAEDSHASLAVSWKTAEELRACEWLPFQAAGAGDMVMVGHVAVPELTGDGTPATFSRLLVMDILRNELGFSGLIVTDSLSMGAVTKAYTPAEAALGALNAGCDLLLMPEDLPEAFEAVLQALAEGTLDEQTLNETVLRILEFKLGAGMMKTP